MVALLRVVRPAGELGTPLSVSRRVGIQRKRPSSIYLFLDAQQTSSVRIVRKRMIHNTLYLPELREMLAENNAAELREFCTALHPARTADFMEGLTPDETWAVLRHADPERRAQIFRYFDLDRQVELITSGERHEVAQLIADLPPDDRVDILANVDRPIVEELLALVPAEDRRDIKRLQSYPEGTAGALMTTDFARLSEDLTVAEARDAVQQQSEELETIYYLYVVDREDHLRGMLSWRELALAKPDTRVGDIMERDVVTVHVGTDQEEVARTVARFDFLAIPVVDDEYRMVGIVTHDDVMDVVIEEATEDAQRISGIDPLENAYLETELFTITWKRGFWLTFLFFAGMLTAMALEQFKEPLGRIQWLVYFIPLVIGSGGNSGGQSAALVITALSRGDVTHRDWVRIVRRELATGLLLGTLLALFGYAIALTVAPSPVAALIVPITVLLVVVCGTLLGAQLPLLFHRLGVDPALMSNPLLAGIIDILGIVIYMSVAVTLLSPQTG